MNGLILTSAFLCLLFSHYFSTQTISLQSHIGKVHVECSLLVKVKGLYVASLTLTVL